jgi:hypothetical protein
MQHLGRQSPTCYLTDHDQHANPNQIGDKQQPGHHQRDSQPFEVKWPAHDLGRGD